MPAPCPVENRGCRLGSPGGTRSTPWPRLLSTWKTSTPDCGEMYLRRHWFSIETATGERMTVYCERQAKNPKKPKARWWLYTIRT
ncbi:MAG: DUF6504 family protein [Tepidisphaeraceae bacterium]